MPGRDRGDTDRAVCRCRAAVAGKVRAFRRFIVAADEDGIEAAAI